MWRGQGGNSIWKIEPFIVKFGKLGFYNGPFYISPWKTVNLDSFLKPPAAFVNVSKLINDTNLLA